MLVSVVPMVIRYITDFMASIRGFCYEKFANWNIIPSKITYTTSKTVHQSSPPRRTDAWIG